jgi:hypothetical protein
MIAETPSRQAEAYFLNTVPLLLSKGELPPQ